VRVAGDGELLVDAKQVLVEHLVLPGDVERLALRVAGLVGAAPGEAHQWGCLLSSGDGVPHVEAASAFVGVRVIGVLVALPGERGPLEFGLVQGADQFGVEPFDPRWPRAPASRSSVLTQSAVARVSTSFVTQ
jgi:hypothetical protein